jgi:hypothetical protein
MGHTTAGGQFRFLSVVISEGSHNGSVLKGDQGSYSWVTLIKSAVRQTSLNTTFIQINVQTVFWNTHFILILVTE